MVVVEGVKLKAKRIPKKQLALEWKKLSDKPLPKVKAFKLSDYDFEQMLHQRSCAEDKIREMVEWGRILPVSGTDACVFNAEEKAEADYIILIRENSYHSQKEIIRHELNHIAQGDL